MRISVTQATTVTNMSAFGLSKRIRPIADDDHRCVARPTGCAGREIRSGVKAIEPSYSACRAAIRRTIFRLLQPVFTQFDFVRPVSLLRASRQPIFEDWKGASPPPSRRGVQASSFGLFDIVSLAPVRAERRLSLGKCAQRARSTIARHARPSRALPVC
jgi:hypothetical protein